MFWKTKSPLSEDDEEWQVECWNWLLNHFGGIAEIRTRALVLPNDEFFPPSGAKGHEKARHVFGCVARVLNVPAVAFDLIAQDETVDPVVSNLAIVQNAPVSPAGTFQADKAGRLTITYDPAILERPFDMVATFAHELCHPILLALSDPPPGGEECEEFATDLAVSFFGFGLFGANAAFEFRQFSDMGSGSQGWSTRRSGYLTEAEWGFSLAVFLRLSDQPPVVAYQHLKPAPLSYLKKSLKYLHENDHLEDLVLNS